MSPILKRAHCRRLNLELFVSLLCTTAIPHLLKANLLMQMPVGLPPGMDPGMAKELIEYLRKNPEVARKTYSEAQRLLQVGYRPEYVSEQRG